MSGWTAFILIIVMPFQDILIDVLQSQQKLPITASIQQWNVEETQKLVEQCDLVMPFIVGLSRLL